MQTIANTKNNLIKVEIDMASSTLSLIGRGEGEVRVHFHVFDGHLYVRIWWASNLHGN